MTRRSDCKREPIPNRGRSGFQRRIRPVRLSSSGNRRHRPERTDEAIVKAKEWTAFGLLGLIWGSSFLWIRIAVQDIGPFTLVALRLLFGLLGLLAVMAYKKQPIPRDRRTLRSLAIMGI